MSKTEWKEYTIDEICLKVTDGSHYSPKEVSGGMYMVSVRDFNEYGFDFEHCKRISQEDYVSLEKSGCVPEIDDILIGKDGANFFEDIIIYKQHERPAMLSSIAILRPNKKIVNPKYLYYAMKNPLFKKDVRDNYGTGSAIPRIVLKDFKRMNVEIPPLAEQQRIAKILSSLDDKIELNNAINRNLEEQAQAIFKSWFIDFEPFGGIMPKDWKIGKLGDLVKRTINGDWGKDEPMGTNTEEVFCIRGADIPEVKKGNKGKMPIRYILPKNYQQKKLEDGDLVVEISGGSPTQSTGRAAYISDALLERYNNKFVCTNFCKAIKFKKNYSIYMYFYWIYLYDKGIFFSYENGTTGIKNLDVSGILENEEIVIPSMDFLSKFNAYCNTAFKRISANGAETEQLGILRDTLLPKLINNEV